VKRRGDLAIVVKLVDNFFHVFDRSDGYFVAFDGEGNSGVTTDIVAFSGRIGGNIDKIDWFW